MSRWIKKVLSAAVVALTLTAGVGLSAGPALASDCQHSYSRYYWKVIYVPQTVAVTSYDCYGRPYTAYKTVYVKKYVKVYY